jgi:thiazole synthase
MAEQGSDVLIVGGGILGLAIALELRQQGATVTVLSKDFRQAAGHAAAGMLAPRAEGLAPGPMLDLCLASLERYADWVNKLEALTGAGCGLLAQWHFGPPLVGLQGRAGDFAGWALVGCGGYSPLPAWPG